MKHIKLFILAALVVCSSAYAAEPPFTGLHQQGWVIVSSTTLSGHFNVRFNPSSGDETSYIHMGHTANSSVNVSAYDAGTSTYFTCSIATSSSIYNQAVDIQNNLTDGAYVFVSKDGNTCTSIYMAKATMFQY